MPLPRVMSIVINMKDVTTAFIPWGPEQRAKYEDNGEMISAYLTELMEKAHGKANVIVTNDKVVVEWVPEARPTGDTIETLYASHMVQAGLLKDSQFVISSTVYKGDGPQLLQILYSICVRHWNEALIDRELDNIVAAAPLMDHAWFVHGMVKLEHRALGAAMESFAKALSLNACDYMSWTYMGLVQLKLKQPKNALQSFENALRVLGENGKPPTRRLRISYGYALKACRMSKESAAQFQAVCGDNKVKMTLAQWVDWGYRLLEDEVDAALVNPVRKPEQPT
jgi:tetratricopeptide (TPR) repeat protein